MREMRPQATRNGSELAQWDHDAIWRALDDWPVLIAFIEGTNIVPPQEAT